jgi:hypothetical protein
LSTGITSKEGCAQLSESGEILKYKSTFTTFLSSIPNPTEKNIYLISIAI